MTTPVTEALDRYRWDTHRNHLFRVCNLKPPEIKNQCNQTGSDNEFLPIIRLVKEISGEL